MHLQHQRQTGQTFRLASKRRLRQLRLRTTLPPLVFLRHSDIDVCSRSVRPDSLASAALAASDTLNELQSNSKKYVAIGK